MPQAARQRGGRRFGHAVPERPITPPGACKYGGMLGVAQHVAGHRVYRGVRASLVMHRPLNQHDAWVAGNRAE